MGQGKFGKVENSKNFLVKKEEKRYTVTKGNSPKKGHMGIGQMDLPFPILNATQDTPSPC